MRLIDQLVELQAKRLAQHPLCSSASHARSEIRREWVRLLREARIDGVIEVLEGDRGLRAAIVLAYAPAFYDPKTKRATGQIWVDPRDTQAMSWARRTLLRHRELLSRNALLQLDAQLVGLLPTLARCGVHVHAVLLLGEVRTGLCRLKQHYSSLGWEDVPGLRLEKIRNLRQVREAVAIVKREFRRNPQFGSFVGSDANLARTYRKLRDASRGTGHEIFVIVSDRAHNRGKVLGYFGCDFRRRSRFGRPTSGVELAFDRSIQGKGLSPRAYATLFAVMLRRRIQVYLGGTSQPPVLKLARLLGRQRIAFALEGQPPYFSRRHFKVP